VTGEEATYEIADDGSFSAPMEVSYPYSRTLGATMSRFFTSLRDRRIEGNVGSDGRVYSPPAEFDPVTGIAMTEWVDVADSGTITSWCWDPDQACGWALVQLDGADVPMMHRVRVESAEQLSTGMRVVVRWAPETVGAIGDIECFEPEGS
jgi:uncharacterized protein